MGRTSISSKRPCQNCCALAETSSGLSGTSGSVLALALAESAVRASSTKGRWWRQVCEGCGGGGGVDGGWGGGGNGGWWGWQWGVGRGWQWGVAGVCDSDGSARDVGAMVIFENAGIG